MASDETGEYDVVAARVGLIEHPTNDFETLTNMIKGLMGVGMLGIPFAFRFCGLFAGLVGTMIVALMAGYGIHLLIHSTHEIYRRLHIPFLSYAGLAKKSFDIGPKKLKVFGNSAAIIADILIWIDLFGCCVSYTIFIAETIRQIVDAHQPEARHYFGVRSYIAFMLVPLLVISLIRHLKYLAYTSTVANVIMLTGCGCTFYYMLRSPINPISSRPYVVSVTKFPVFFCITLFAVECMAVIMSLENSMGNPKHMTMMPGIVCVGFCFAATLFGSIGFCGYLKYGDAAKANISLNIPEDEIISQIVKLLIAAGVFITFGLQFYVTIEIMTKYLEMRFGELKLRWIYCLRELTCTGAVLIAWLLPSIGGMIALVGALGCSVLGLIFPATFDLLLFYNRGKCRAARYIVDLFMICVGLIALICGTYLSILEIIHDLYPDEALEEL